MTSRIVGSRVLVVVLGVVLAALAAGVWAAEEGVAQDARTPDPVGSDGLELVSGAPSGPASSPSASRDGRFVAFASEGAPRSPPCSCATC